MEREDVATSLVSAFPFYLLPVLGLALPRLHSDQHASTREQASVHMSYQPLCACLLFQPTSLRSTSYLVSSCCASSASDVAESRQIRLERQADKRSIPPTSQRRERHAPIADVLPREHCQLWAGTSSACRPAQRRNGIPRSRRLCVPVLSAG